MIVQCPACRELAKVERALVEPNGARVGLPCSACGVVTWLPAAPSSDAGAGKASAAEASAVDPKLEEAVLGLPASGAGEQAVVDGLRALLPRWNDAEAHRALIQSAQSADSLPALAVRYRRVLEALPGDVAARRAQQEILGLAMATFSTMGGPSATDRHGGYERTRALAALVVVGLFLLLGVGALFFTLQAL